MAKDTGNRLGVQIDVEFSDAKAIASKLKSIMSEVDKQNSVINIDTSKFNASIKEASNFLSDFTNQLNTITKAKFQMADIKTSSFRQQKVDIQETTNAVSNLRKEMKMLNAQKDGAIKSLAKNMGIRYTKEFKEAIMQGLSQGDVDKVMADVTSRSSAKYYKTQTKALNDNFKREYSDLMKSVQGKEVQLPKTITGDQFKQLKADLNGYVKFTANAKTTIQDMMTDIGKTFPSVLDGRKTAENQLKQLAEISAKLKQANKGQLQPIGLDQQLSDKVGKEVSKTIATINKAEADYKNLQATVSKPIQPDMTGIEKVNDKLKEIKAQQGQVLSVSNTYEEDDKQTKKMLETVIRYKTALGEVKTARINLANAESPTKVTEKDDFEFKNKKAQEFSMTIEKLQGQLSQKAQYGLFDSKTIDNIQRQLNSLTVESSKKQIADLEIAIKNLGTSDSGITRLKNQIESSSLAITKLKQSYGNFVPEQELNTFDSKLSTLKTMFDNLQKGVVVDSEAMKRAVNEVNISFKALEDVSKANQKTGVAVQKDTYKQLNDLQKEEYSLKTSMIKLDEKSTQELQQQLSAVKEKQRALQGSLNSSGLSDIKQQTQLMTNRNALESKYLTELAKEEQKIATLKNIEIERMKASQKTGQALYGKNYDTSASNEAIKKAQQLSGSYANVKTKLTELNGEMKALNATARNDSLVRSSSTITSLFNTLSRFGIFMSGAVIVRKFFQEFKEGLEHVKYLDNAFTDLSITMDITRNQFNDMVGNIQELAKANGNTVTDVTEIAKVYANANASVEEIQSKLVPSVAFANVSRMNTGEVTSTLQSVNNQFKLTSENGYEAGDALEHIGNVLVTVSQNMAYDFGRGLVELNEAIKASGSVAEMSGQSLESFSAMAGAFIEQTGKSGSEFATAYRMISARVLQIKEIADEEGLSTQDMSKAEKALKSLDITIRDGEKGLKSLDDILYEVADKWGDLEDQEKQYVSEMLAGNRQRSSFVAIMESMNKQQNLYGKAMDSNGALMTANEKYVDSLEGKMKTLTATVQTVWANLIESDVIKGAVELLTSFIGTLGDAIDTFGLAPTAIMAVVTAMTLLNKSFASMATAMQPAFITRWIGGLNTLSSKYADQATAIRKQIEVQKVYIQGTKNLGLSVTGAQKRLVGMGAQLGATTLKMGATTIATKALSIATSVGLSMAISACVVGLGKLIDALITTRKEVQENNLELDTFAKDNIRAMGDLEDKLNRIEYLQAQINAVTTSDKERVKYTKELAELQQQLGETYPDLVTGYNEEGIAIAENNELLRAKIELMKEEAKIKADEFVKDNGSELGNLAKNYKNAKLKMTGGQRTDEYTTNVNGVIEKRKIVVDVEMDKKAGVKELQEIQTLATQARTQLESMKKAGMTDEEIQSQYGFIVNQLNDYDKAIKQANEDSKNLADDGLSEVESGLENTASKAEKAKASMKALTEEFTGATSQLELVTKAIKEFNEYGGLTSDTIASLAENDMLDLVVQGNVIENLTKKQKSLAEEQDNVFMQMARNAVGYENTSTQAVVKGENDKTKAITTSTNNQNKIVKDGADAKNNIFGGLANAISLTTGGAMNALGGMYAGDVNNFNKAQESKLKTLSKVSATLANLFGMMASAMGGAWGGVYSSLERAFSGLRGSIDGLITGYTKKKIKIPKIELPEIVDPSSSKDKDKAKKKAEDEKKKRLQAEKDANSAIEKMRDKLIRAIQRKYEEAREKELSAVEKQIKSIESRYNKLIKEKQDELDKLNNGGVTDAEKIKALRKELEQWKKNDSAESAQRQKDLEKQIAILEKEQEIKSLEERRDKELKDQEAKKDSINNKYDKLLKEQSIYNEANKLLQTKNWKEMSRLMEKYGEEWKDIARVNGKSIKRIIDGQIKELQKAYKTLGSKAPRVPGSSSGGSGSSGSNSGGSSSKPPAKKPTTIKDNSKVKVTKTSAGIYVSSTAKKNSGTWSGAGVKSGQPLYVVNVANGRFALSKKKGGTALGWIDKKYLTPYAVGGVVPRDTMIYAHKNERVLTKEQTQAFENLVNNVLPMMKSLSVTALRNAEKKYDNVNNSTDNSSTSVTIEQNYNVVNNTPFDVKQFGGSLNKQLAKELNKQGIKLVNK